MTLIRAFIAVSMPAEIQSQLKGVIADLKRELGGVPIRWVPAENIHLTLKFLGDISSANLEMLKGILDTAATGCQVFELSVGQLGAFPSKRRPRVIWVGVQAPADLQSMQRVIETETARLGYRREERPFSPHLTLGRTSRNASSGDVRRLSSVVADFEVGFLGAARINTISLYRSDLRPGGAVYTRLYRANFES